MTDIEREIADIRAKCVDLARDMQHKSTHCSKRIKATPQYSLYFKSGIELYEIYQRRIIQLIAEQALEQQEQKITQCEVYVKIIERSI